ncbi:hypothetical protein KASHIRA_00990 [Serratia phage vB_SmaM-Kashira]|nr:hypothetical protein [Acinetobacter phage ABPH49]URC22673.1 hypothetical protein KASHIRA_00990 [Serratia phage vB_SmaM-Kashira]
MTVEDLIVDLKKATTEEEVATSLRDWLVAHDKQTEEQYEGENIIPEEIS